MREELGLHPSQWLPHGTTQEEWRTNSDPIVIDRWYNDSTFSLLLHISEAKYYHYVGTERKMFSLLGQTDEVTDKIATLAEIHSKAYGRCTILKPIVCITNREDLIKVVLEIQPGMDNVNLFLFESGVEKLGIGLDCWLAHFKVLEVKQNKDIRLRITKSTSILAEGTIGCSEDVSMLDYLYCVETRARELLKGNMNVCHWPTLGDWLRGRQVCDTKRPYQPVNLLSTLL